MRPTDTIQPLARIYDHDQTEDNYTTYRDIVTSMRLPYVDWFLTSLPTLLCTLFALDQVRRDPLRSTRLSICPHWSCPRGATYVAA